MNRFPDVRIDNPWVTSKRGEKNPVDPYRPAGYFTEQEYAGPGSTHDFATILLANNECPFRCLMCDLWKNTTDEPVPPGAIPEQIRFALAGLPRTSHLKLYNSGSFFDTRAIPPADYPAVARLVSHCEMVVVESHPHFIGDHTLFFRDLLRPVLLQVAVGLETVHPEVLHRLNKKMDLAEFERSIGFLSSHGITSRAFILLRPPFLSEKEGILWANKSIDFAFSKGVQTCVVIPVRSGNGALDVLARQSYFAQPDIRSLEAVMEYGLGLDAGPVFADLWDIDRFSSCESCLEQRKERLLTMNLNQCLIPPVNCSCSGS